MSEVDEGVAVVEIVVVVGIVPVLIVFEVVVEEGPKALVSAVRGSEEVGPAAVVVVVVVVVILKGEASGSRLPSRLYGGRRPGPREVECSIPLKL